MKEILYKLVGVMAIVHNRIMQMNDSSNMILTDKQLHFLVIGIMGMAMIFVVYPLFKWMAKHNHVMVIAWIYVFTLILVITFAIEIGQGFTHTGNMDFVDIVAGILGFFAMFAVFAVIRGIYHGICYLLGKWDDKIDARNEK